MKKLFRLLAAALAAALLCAGFAACGDYRGMPGTDPNNPGGVTPEETTYEIDFNLPIGTTTEISVIIPDNDYERAIMGALIEGFNQVYPNITVNVNTLVINNYNETIMRQYNADVLADVIWCNSQNFYFLVGNGYALNLNGFIEQGEAAGEFDYDVDFTEDFQNMGVLSGARFSVPRSIDSVVCFYNKGLLTAAGVDMSVIQNGWTWETFLSVCQQVREYYDNPTAPEDPEDYNNPWVLQQAQPNYFPVDANLGWESVAYPIIRSLGGEVLNEQGDFALTESASAEIVSFVQNLVTNHYVPTAGEQTSSFESGTGAFLFQSTSLENYASRQLLQYYGTNEPAFDIVSFPLINGADSKIGMGYAGYALNSRLDDEGKDPVQLSAAALFLNYLMSYDGQQKAAGDGQLTLPSIRSDLSFENTDANWHKEFSDTFNVEAYTWGSQYKLREEFLDHTSAVFTSDLIAAMNAYVGTDAVRDPQNAFTRFREEVEYVFDSII